MKQKMPRYEMHKYWGKKPSKDLLMLIEKYSKPGDIVLDPFAGYGVFVCEAYLNNRNAIGNDLNPSSVFIQEQLLNEEVNLTAFEKELKNILNEQKNIESFWYTAVCPKCGSNAKVVSTLRSKDDFPLMNRIKCNCTAYAFEYELSENESLELLKKEKNNICASPPISKLIRNGRISAFDNMTTDNLFTKRAIQCHLSIFNLIKKIEDLNLLNLAKFTFTSNLANCSKLVPPIKSRGAMAPGAWMTGFYIGEKYLENNVFHYFQNRLEKVLSGKKDFNSQNHRLDSLPNKGRVEKISDFDKISRSYLLSNHDTKKLNLPDQSVDYIFTDPPYGDSVPYFEQSIIWNTWLGFNVDYDNEVVISDSKVRSKRPKHFEVDIRECIREIYRVLKNNCFFSITYHSISGNEWYSLTKACLESGFYLHEVQWLTQKTFAPRQLNRMKTVKGDMLITFKKSVDKPKLIYLDKQQTELLIFNEVKCLLMCNKLNTNDIYVSILQKIFTDHIVFESISFIEILANNFSIDDDGFWYLD